MKTKTFLTACALSVSLASVAPAQPEVKDTKPVAPAEGKPKWNDWRNMTPAQRQETIKKAQRQSTATLLTGAGITDVPTQNAIQDFLEEKNAAGEEVRKASSELMTALAGNRRRQWPRPNAAAPEVAKPEATDAEITALLIKVREAVETEKTRRDEATKKLDDKIHFTDNPRVEAFLTMMGAIGDESLYTGGLGGMMGGGNWNVGNKGKDNKNKGGNDNKAGDKVPPADAPKPMPAPAPRDDMND